MSAMPWPTWTDRSRSTRRCSGFRSLMRKTLGRRRTSGTIVGYPGLVLDGAFFQLPNGVILELLEYKTPEAWRRRHGELQRRERPSLPRDR